MSLLAGWREKRERGELSLELSSSRTRVQVLEEMAMSMLACVQALVLDLDEIGGPELQAQLTSLSGRLKAGSDPATLGDELVRARRDTLEFAEAERRHLATRDAELRHIIQTLSDGLHAVSSGAAAYHKKLLENGQRFEAASRLSDLVKMRTAIQGEVSALRVAVAERQKQETSVNAALRHEIDTLKVKVESEKKTARLDALTQASNRTAFDEELARRCELASIGSQEFSLLLADVDHFKAINDTHGHQVGDRVLHALVTFLRDHTRQGDTVARWGGEEFSVILPGASQRAAFAKGQGSRRRSRAQRLDDHRRPEAEVHDQHRRDRVAEGRLARGDRRACRQGALRREARRPQPGREDLS